MTSLQSLDGIPTLSAKLEVVIVKVVQQLALLYYKLPPKRLSALILTKLIRVLCHSQYMLSIAF